MSFERGIVFKMKVVKEFEKSWFFCIFVFLLDDFSEGSFGIELSDFIVDECGFGPQLTENVDILRGQNGVKFEEGKVVIVFEYF
jgi:hypothetical protein